MFKERIGKDVILGRIALVINDFFDCPDATISLATVALDIDGWDSLAQTILMLELESEFGIRFTAAEILRFDNVSEIVEAIYYHEP